MAVFTMGVVSFKDKVEALKDLLSEVMADHDGEVSDRVFAHLVAAEDGLGWAVEQDDEDHEGED